MGGGTIEDLGHTSGGKTREENTAGPSWYNICRDGKIWSTGGDAARPPPRDMKIDNTKKIGLRQVRNRCLARIVGTLKKDLASIVQDLLELQTLAGNPPSESTSASSTLSKTAADVTKRGLRYALGWAAMEVRNARKAAQGASSAATATTTTTHRSMPSLPGIVSTVSAYPPSTRRLSMQSATPRQGHMPPLADQSRLDSHQRHLSPLKSGRLHSSYDSLPPILVAPDEMKRGSHYEHSGPGAAQSPQTSSGGSVYGTGQSPMQSLGVGRSLPSPPGTHFSHAGIPPSSYSHVSASQAAHTSHLQDLQHQISTKALALQTLQREHDALLAAFSRSQIRCNTLDKKSEVSSHEINTLTEEKIRLQQQVEALESQIADLSKARDDVQRQSSADGAQWRQIMAMSSQLQMKSAEDARLHKVAEDAWHEEREGLKRRIQELEEKSAVNPVSRSKSNAESPGPGSDDGDVMRSQPLQALRGEVLHLRNRLAGMENLLREVTGETEQIDQAMKAMVNIRARISGQIGDDGESSHG